MGVVTSPPSAAMILRRPPACLLVGLSPLKMRVSPVLLIGRNHHGRAWRRPSHEQMRLRPPFFFIAEKPANNKIHARLMRGGRDEEVGAPKEHQAGVLGGLAQGVDEGERPTAAGRVPGADEPTLHLWLHRGRVPARDHGHGRQHVHRV
jgi:hypothetical protein